MLNVARCAIAASAFALLGASDIGAQAPTAHLVVTSTSRTGALPAGPSLLASSAGVRAVAPAQSTRNDLASALRQERRASTRRDVALMIVGGAAVVTGLLIGDDAGALLAVGGAVVGLYGLYQFVR